MNSFTDEESLKWIRRFRNQEADGTILDSRGGIKCLTKTCISRELEEMILKDFQEATKIVSLEILQFVKRKYFTISFNNMKGSEYITV